MRVDRYDYEDGTWSRIVQLGAPESPALVIGYSATPEYGCPHYSVSLYVGKHAVVFEVGRKCIRLEWR